MTVKRVYPTILLTDIHAIGSESSPVQSIVSDVVFNFPITLVRLNEIDYRIPVIATRLGSVT